MAKDELLRRLNDIEWDDFEVKEATGGLPKSMCLGNDLNNTFIHQKHIEYLKSSEIIVRLGSDRKGLWKGLK